MQCRSYVGLPTRAAAVVALTVLLLGGIAACAAAPRVASAPRVKASVKRVGGKAPARAPGRNRVAGSRQETPKFELHTGHSHEEIGALAWQPGRDSPDLASAGADAAIYLWNATARQVRRAYDYHKVWVCALAWSPDGRCLASSSKDRTVKVNWLDIGSPRTAHLRNTNALSIGWSADGKTLALGLENGSVAFWEPLTAGASPQPVGGEHHRAVSVVAWHPQRNLLVSAGAQGEMRLWDGKTRQVTRRWESFTKVSALAWSPDGKRLAYAGEDGQIAVAGLDSLEKPARWSHGDHVRGLTWIDRGALLASGGSDSCIRVWDPADPREPKTLKCQEDVSALSWSESYGLLASASRDRVIRLWNLKAGDDYQELRGRASEVRSLAWGKHKAHGLVSGSRDRLIRLWNPRTGALQRELSGHAYPVVSLAWKADGSRFASGDDGGQVFVWDPDAPGDPVGLKLSSEVLALAWSPDGSILASGSGSRDGIVLWNAERGVRIREFPRETSGVLSLAWSPDGKFLASGGGDHSVRVWDLTTGTHRLFPGHIGQVWAVAWHPSRPILVSGDDHGTLRFWDPEKGTALGDNGATTKPGAVGHVSGLRWSPDGKRLACATEDGAVHLFDEASRETARLPGRGRALKAVAWDPDSTVVASGDKEGIVRLWTPNGAGRQWVALVGMTDSDWLAVTEQGFYCGTPEGTKGVHWRGGLASGRRRSFFENRTRVQDALEGKAQKPADVPRGDAYPAVSILWAPETNPGNGGTATIEVLVSDDGAIKSIEVMVANRPVEPVLHQIDAGELSLREDANGRKPIAIDAKALMVNGMPVYYDPRDQRQAGPRQPTRLADGQDVKGVPGSAPLTLYPGDLPPSHRTGGHFRLTVKLPPGLKSVPVEVTAVDNRDLSSYPAQVSIEQPEAEHVRGRLHALCVGVQRYANTAFNLAYADRDAEAVAKLLQGQGSLYRERPRVDQLVNEQATSRNVRERLDVISNGVQPEDTVVLYFSGHGLQQEHDFYFATHDVDLTRLPHTAVTMRDLNTFTKRLNGVRLILIADSCYSGSIPAQTANRDNLPALLKHVSILASSGASQVSREDSERKHGVFTAALLEAFRRPGAEKHLTFADLHRYVAEELRARGSRQSPIPYHFSESSSTPLFERP